MSNNRIDAFIRPPYMIAAGARSAHAKRLACAAAMVWLAGCAITESSIQPDKPVPAPPAKTASAPESLATMPPSARTDLFGTPPDIPEFGELTTVSDERQREFLEYFNAAERAEEKPHMRMAEYLERRLGPARFENTTLGADETLAANRGNCMSLALATTALAQLVGIEVDWLLTGSNPVYSSDGAVIYSANHIHTKLYDPTFEPDPMRLTFVRPHVLVDYFTDRVPFAGSTLKEHQVMALTYLNLAAEAMAEDDLNRAFWLAHRALVHDQENPDIFNTLGVLHQRVGANDEAEAFYRHALEAFDDKLVVLRNYHGLLAASGRGNEARALEQRILALPDPDPYPLLEFGDQRLAEGKVHSALDYYARAQKVAPYLHEVYWKTARAYLELGNLSRTREAIAAALESAASTSDRKRYKAKLSTLKHGIEPGRERE